MLLLDKVGSRLKNKSIDQATAFSLPLSLISSFTGEARFKALNDLVGEAADLKASLDGSETVSFLGGTM